MNFVVLGTNYKKSPLKLREKLSFSLKQQKEIMLYLKGVHNIEGAVILSTCNRLEIYISSFDVSDSISSIKKFLMDFCKIKNKQLDRYFYTYEDKKAACHLYNVACGLDSLILGETQILSQVKAALNNSQNSGFSSASLNHLFTRAICFSGTIRSQSEIFKGKISVGSVAIDFIKDRYGDLSDKKVLIVGVGKISELVLKYLMKERPKVVFLSNRTYEKAKELADKIGAEAIKVYRLKEMLKDADIVIAATASPHFIVKKKTIDGVVRRNHKRLFIMDLAVPRDVDPAVKRISGVELYCLEDLNKTIKKNINRKVKEAKRIKNIILLEVNKI